MPFTEDDFEKYCAEHSSEEISDIKYDVPFRELTEKLEALEDKASNVIGNGFSMPKFSDDTADEMVEFIDKVGSVKGEILEIQEQLERVYNVLEEMESDFPQSAWDGAEDDSTGEDW